MSDLSRPRPRPRPKPNATALPSGCGQLELLQSHGVDPIKTVEDEDEKFIRNRARTTKAWERIDELNKVAETKVVHIPESDSDESQGTPRLRKTRKKKSAPTRNVNNTLNRLLLVNHSSDSENDTEIEFLGFGEDSRALKRRKTRSRSITPPPAVPLHYLQSARALVHKTLNTLPRSISPGFIADDDSEEDDTFTNPELARIALSVASRARTGLPVLSTPVIDRDTVEISVRWKPHPQDTLRRERCRVFKMNRDDNFRPLFEATADEASILTENLIVTFRGKRIFSSVTPTTLQIWDKAELVACDQVTHEYTRTNLITYFQSEIYEETTTDTCIEVLSDVEVPVVLHTVESTPEAEGDTFRLVLRSAITQDVTLTVRPTTCCGAIVKAFLKKAGVEAQYPEVFDQSGGAKNGRRLRGRKTLNEGPRLSIDGEKMSNDAEIGEAELEDGDQIEVVGL